MKHKAILLLIIIILTGITPSLIIFRKMIFGGVEQEFESNIWGLTKSGKGVSTRVWYKMEIIESWYDDTSTLSDSLLIHRKEQGEKLLKTLKDNL